MSRRASRIIHYVNVMFPPAVLVPASILKFYGIYFSFQLIHGVTDLSFNLESASAAITLTTFTLLARVYDELKDAEADMRLGKAGDPRYADRPIVTGAVLVEDIVFFRNILIGILILTNIWLPPMALIGFAVAFLAVWLSSVWFFYPKISESLFLALLTHNPLVLFIQGYVLMFFYSQFPDATFTVEVIPLMIGLWLPMAAWEISRKQRIPEDETDYETYSKMWGWKVASLVPSVIVVMATALLLHSGSVMGLPETWAYVMMGVTVIPILAGLRFRLSPSTKTSHLQPFTEAYILTCDLSIFVAQVVTFGAIWI